MMKKILCLLLAAVLCCTPVLAAPAPAHHVEAKAAILYELNTDTILLEQDADMKLFPASTTKLMTALVALEYGNPDDVVTVTNEAIDGLYEMGSASYLLNNEQIAFMDLLRYLLIGSGNDAANALAIHVSGSIEGFVDLMNNRAKELGMTNTHFTNPHGYHDPDHYTSAWDMYLITKAAMEYEDFMTICDTVTVLRDGSVVFDGGISEVTEADIAYHMVGHTVRTEQLKRKVSIGDEALAVEDLSCEGMFRNISFSVKKGEIIGFTGLLGDGRSELFQTVFGCHPEYSGKIRIGGQQQVDGLQIGAEPDPLGIFTGGADGQAVARCPDGIQGTGEPAAEDRGLAPQMLRQFRHDDVHEPKNFHCSFSSSMPT